MGAQARIRYPSKAAIDKTIAAARAAGLDIAGIEVGRDGTIRLVEARAIPKKNMDEFERLEAQGLL